MTDLAAMAGLTAAGAFSAAAALWAFARFSDQAKIRATRRRIKASMYEMRLFVDEPMVLLRAQKHLLTANLRYLGLMLRPAALISLPMILLMSTLDTIYGYRPLQPGESALLTVYVRPNIDLRVSQPEMEAPSAVVVETPVVRIPAEQRFCWRIRATRPGPATVRVIVNGALYEKSLDAGSGFTWLSRQRVRSLLQWILHPTEKRLPPGAVERIEIVYPEAAIHWIKWYLLATLIAAICLRRRFGVTL